MPGSSGVPILLVDDKESNLFALEAVLEPDGYDLVSARSGGDAVNAVAGRDFAVVLLDVQMPDMDGLRTAQMLRDAAGRRGGRVPILFVTGIDTDASRVRAAYEVGAVDFIQKPLVPEVIRAKVAVFADLYRARRELDAERERTSAALAALADLAAGLADARSPADVATVIVDRGMRVAQADTCSVYALDEAESALELVGHRGIDPKIVEQIRRITDVSAPGTFEALRTGASTWAENDEDYTRTAPHLAHTPGRRVHAFWRVPLLAEGHAVGLLGMGFVRERHFTREERALVETMSKQCAQALLRATRLAREERARALLAITLHSIGDAVMATDPEGRVTFMNAVAERLTGWRESEARGQRLEEVFDILSEETRIRCESPVVKVLREGRVVGLANHTVLRHRSGKETPIDDSAAPIRDAAGALFGVVLVFRDASTEKREHARRAFLVRAGAALASSLDYKATLVTAAQAAVPQLADWCAVDLLEPGASQWQQVAVAHVNPEKVRWARELGQKYPPDPNAASGVPQVIRSGVAELYPEIPAALLESGARDAEHLRMIRELRLESAMVVPLRGRSAVLGAMTFIYAESGRRYSEDDLAFAEEFARRAAMAIENARAYADADRARAEERVLRAEADAANKAKDEFLAMVSHELRTPLNAILGWTTTLRARTPPEDFDRALAVIERNARRQARLIEDVLDVSRIISGKLTLNVGPTKLADVIANAVEAVAPAADAKDVRIATEVDGSITVMADGDRLQQVVWNLVANAVKFTPKSGGAVTVRASREGSEIRVTVADHGEGIPRDALPYIFEPFRQVDASTTRRHGGLGLGLAIVKQLVFAHGGTIHAESEGLGRGARFVIALPARALVPTVRDRTMPAQAPEVPASSATAPRLDGLSVLVVDDEEDARGIISQVLSEKGAAVRAASSAAEALESLEAGTVDVIVSDIGMPAMDGYAFIRKVRALPPARGGRTPALALTAYARREDAQRAFAAGFQMHVTKPVEPTQLVTVVANLAGLSLPS